MTSDDTHEKTEALLRANGYFGMEEGQVTLLKQEKVPALEDNDAHFARDGTYGVQTKPHGHGDVHLLLHMHGVAKAWLAAGLQHVVFFQDTNALCMRSLPATLGVSVKHGLHMNSMTIPRSAGEAVGAIVALKREDGTSLTCNVEYNQLDPLLR